MCGPAHVLFHPDKKYCMLSPKSVCTHIYVLYCTPCLFTQVFYIAHLPPIHSMITTLHSQYEALIISSCIYASILPSLHIFRAITRTQWSSISRTETTARTSGKNASNIIHSSGNSRSLKVHLHYRVRYMAQNNRRLFVLTLYCTMRNSNRLLFLW